MPAKYVVTCDQCGKDLSEAISTSYIRYHLVGEPIPSTKICADNRAERLDQDAYFCGSHCLSVWAGLRATQYATPAGPWIASRKDGPFSRPQQP